MVAHAAELGLYTNLITSGDRPRRARGIAALAEAGLDHVQLSLQDAEAADADRIAGLPGAQARKLAWPRLRARPGLPLTVNFVVHRQNLDGSAT